MWYRCASKSPHGRAFLGSSGTACGGNPCGPGDVVHAYLVESAGGEQIERDVSDVILGGAATPAHAWPGSRHT
jgi:hypothetical protein